MFTQHALEWISAYGSIAIFALLVLGIVGLPIPDEVLLTFAGSLIARGDLQLAPTVAGALAGTVGGISLSYVLGRSFGHLLETHGRYVHLSPTMVARAHAWFESIGKWTLFIGYFIPGVRHVTALIAGASRLHYGAFALFAYTGGALWVTTFLSLGYMLGEEWKKLAGVLEHYTTIGIGVVVVLIAVLWRLYWRRRSRGH